LEDISRADVAHLSEVQEFPILRPDS